MDTRISDKRYLASMGCSGALFGLIGYMFIDVIVNWKTIARPVRELMTLLLVTVVSLVLGLLPGLDNFAHLGKLTPMDDTLRLN